MSVSQAKSPWLLWTSFGVAIASVSSLGGYWFGLRQDSNAWRKHEPSRNSSAYSHSFECAANLEDEDRGLASGDDLSSQYFQAITRNHLEEKDQKLSRVFGRSEVGRALTRVTVLSEFGPDPKTLEGQVVSDYMRILEGQTQDVMALVLEVFQRPGFESARERQYLIQLVGKLDITETEKVDFFTQEFTRKNSQSSSRAAALVALMRTGVDPTVLDSAMRQALNNSHDYASQLVFLNILGTAYPEEVRKLMGEFRIE